jgi:hypothetical protein
MLTLADEVGEHSIDAQHCQQQGRSGEQRCHKKCEPATRHCGFDDFFDRAKSWRDVGSD